MSQATSTTTSLTPAQQEELNGAQITAPSLPNAAVPSDLPPSQWEATGGAGSADVRQSARIDLVYQEYIECLEAGEEIDPDEFCGRYPSLATSLRSLLRAHSYVHNDCPELVDR